MEKIWIRYFRSFVLSTLTVGASLWAQEPDVKSVVVDVEVQIESDNLAAAKDSARKTAFEKALDQSLPADMDATLRASKLKTAAHFMKSFRVVEEKLEGSILKQKYQCEVLVERDQAPANASDKQDATFEIAWLPGDVQFNAVELLNYVTDVMGTPPTSRRMGRGYIVLTVPLRKSIEDTQSQLATFVGKRGLVKVIRRDETRPADVLPSPVAVPQEFPHFDAPIVSTPSPLPTAMPPAQASSTPTPPAVLPQPSETPSLPSVSPAPSVEATTPILPVPPIELAPPSASPVPTMPPPIMQ